MGLLVESKVCRVLTVSLLLLSLGVFCSASDIYKGQNVCEQRRYSARPVHIRQSYQRPVHTLDLKKCREEGEHPCNRTITTFRTTYRSVLRMRIHTVTVPGCCRGWRKRSPHDISCLQSECSRPCENGGKCIGRESCMCPEGYAGKYCHVDIDECSAGKSPCQQKCINTPGSFECQCVEGFKVAGDARSCDLCLSCSPEFQELQNQVTSLPDELDELAKKYTRSDTQSDMKQAMERQAESFDKLQSQYDTIVDIQKQMDVLPEITARLDNMTELHTQVQELKSLETRVDSVEELVGDGLSSLKDSQTDLSDALTMAEQKWQRDSVAASHRQAEGIDQLQDQHDRMAARVEKLEQDMVGLLESFASTLAKYEDAANALQEKEATPKPAPTNSTGLDDAYYLEGNNSESLPMDTLASLSQQISILEEKMAQCQCDQDYYG